jgi:charged multivesicular body protein 1
MGEWLWACRQKNQSLNFLRMSARVDATSSRVQSALTTKKVTKSMEGVVKVSQSPFFLPSVS